MAGFLQAAQHFLQLLAQFALSALKAFQFRVGAVAQALATAIAARLFAGRHLSVAVTGLAGLPVLAHRPLSVEAEGLVHEFLLAADDVGKFLQRARHLLLLGALLHLSRLQAFEHVAQFAEQLLRLVARA